MTYLVATLLFINSYSFNLAIPFASLAECQAAPGKILVASEIPVEFSEYQCMSQKDFLKMVDGVAI